MEFTKFDDYQNAAEYREALKIKNKDIRRLNFVKRLVDVGVKVGTAKRRYGRLRDIYAKMHSKDPVLPIAPKNHPKIPVPVSVVLTPFRVSDAVVKTVFKTSAFTSFDEYQNSEEYLFAIKEKHPRTVFIDVMVAKGMARASARRRYLRLAELYRTFRPKAVMPAKPTRPIVKEVVDKDTPNHKIPENIPKIFKEVVEPKNTEIGIVEDVIAFRAPAIPDEEERPFLVPDKLKLIQLTDMMRYGKAVSENYLRKNGFDYNDVKWLKLVGVL